MNASEGRSGEHSEQPWTLEFPIRLFLSLGWRVCGHTGSPEDVNLEATVKLLALK
jgi:hypothetical protein